MTLNEQLRQGSINGKNPFLHIPEDIGEILNYYTTNPKSQREHDDSMRIKYALWALLFGGVLVFCLLELSGHVLTTTLIMLTVTGVILYRLTRAREFKGTDYFIGDKGFTVVNFRTTRATLNVKRALYDEISDILYTKKVNYGGDGQTYLHTDFSYEFYGQAQEKKARLLAKISGRFYGDRSSEDEYNQTFMLWHYVEEAWSQQRYAGILDELKRGGRVSFNGNGYSGFIKDYIVFEGPKLTIGNNVYEKEEIKSIKYNSDYLYIKHAKRTGGLLGIGSKGDDTKLSVLDVLNCKLFKWVFRWYVNKYYPNFSDAVSSNNYMF